MEEAAEEAAGDLAVVAAATARAPVVVITRVAVINNKVKAVATAMEVKMEAAGRYVRGAYVPRVLFSSPGNALLHDLDIETGDSGEQAMGMSHNLPQMIFLLDLTGMVLVALRPFHTFLKTLWTGWIEDCNFVGRFFDKIS